MNEQTKKVTLLNLISTPVPVLNSLGLETSVGLSSEDPVGGRHPSETYQGYLTIYSPEGTFVDRLLLGEIPPHRRRLFRVSRLLQNYFPQRDHLVVVHRIPQRFLSAGRLPEDTVELSPVEGDYGMFRTLVQYSFPGGANGSVIYETPSGLNTRRPGRPPSNTLTFTSKILLSKTVNSYLALLYYSVDPAFDLTARYQFHLFAEEGQRVASGLREFRPFTVQLIDSKETIPIDPVDRLACFSFVGYSSDGILIPLILNLDTDKGREAVAVEHTHPAQSYTYPFRPQDKQKLKVRAVQQWKALFPTEAPVPA